MAYQDDKRELLKLKQGLIEESELIKEEKHEQVKLSFWKKIENFFYLNKFFIFGGLFFAAIAVFLLVDLLGKERADVRILYVTSDSSVSSQMQIKQQKVELALEQYCPDFDENGNVHCDVYFIDNSPNIDADYQMVYQAKLYGEISSAEAQMFISDKATVEQVCGDDDVYSVFTDLSKLYPDNENVDGVYYKISGTDFAKLCGWDKSCPDDLYIAIRTTNGGMTSNEENKKTNNARALSLLDNIINGKLQGAVDTTSYLQQ